MESATGSRAITQSHTSASRQYQTVLGRYTHSRHDCPFASGSGGGIGESHGYGEPLNRPHHDCDLAIVFERLGLLAHPLLLLSTSGVCIQSLLKVLPDQ